LHAQGAFPRPQTENKGSCFSPLDFVCGVVIHGDSTC